MLSNDALTLQYSSRAGYSAGTVFTADDAERELAMFYAPPQGTSLRLSMLRSRDGYSAGADGSSRSINGPVDLRILRVVRALADVVIVGAETARAEAYGDIKIRPALADTRVALRPEARPRPYLAIVTRSGSVPVGLDPHTTVVLAPEDTEVSDTSLPVLRLPSGQPLSASITQALVAHGLSAMVCEGGPAIASALMPALTDYCLTTSPLAGGTQTPVTPLVPTGFELVHRLQGSGYTCERWAPKHPPLQ